VLTAPSDHPAFDFVSRCFGPKFGIDEDPVTGSSHCALAPYWADQLGTRELTAYQASKRGGVVRVRLDGDRTHLAGRAVTVATGELVG
jgi:predicted PhzF superfamily epimerase YddE/YHI9